MCTVFCFLVFKKLCVKKCEKGIFTITKTYMYGAGIFLGKQTNIKDIIIIMFTIIMIITILC